MKIPPIAVVALALLSSLPAAAGEHYRHDYYRGEVLNGKLNTYDFNGGVGYAGGYGSSDMGYGGGAYAGGGMMYGYSGSSSSASSSAGASAAAGGATSWMYGYSR